MPLVRISTVEVLRDHVLRLGLTDGRVVERDLEGLLIGAVFERVRNDPSTFRAVRVEHGTLVWPGGADLCPDVLIWGGLPPADGDAAVVAVAASAVAHGSR